LILKSKRVIEKFLSNSFIDTSTNWEKKSVYDFSHFIISNPKSIEGGFPTLCTIKEKEAFYHLANQCINIIYAFAKSVGETKCCIGPFHEFDNFEKWMDLICFDSFNALKTQLNNEQYLVIELLKEEVILNLIVENNFRYFSKISILFPKANVMIEPTHNSEILIVAQDYHKTKDVFLPILDKTDWEILDV